LTDAAPLALPRLTRNENNSQTEKGLAANRHVHRIFAVNEQITLKVAAA